MSRLHVLPCLDSEAMATSRRCDLDMSRNVAAALGRGDESGLFCYRVRSADRLARCRRGDLCREGQYCPLGIRSRVNAISGNGSVLVGQGPDGAWRWTIEDPPPLDGDDSTWERAISADRGIVAGGSWIQCFSPVVATMWNEQGDVRVLGVLPDHDRSLVSAISADGLAFVGGGRDTMVDGSSLAFHATIMLASVVAARRRYLSGCENYRAQSLYSNSTR